MEPEDIDLIYGWENDPEIWIYGAAHQPFSRYELQRFIEESSNCDIYSSHQLRLMADDNAIGCVGCVDLYDFDPFHHRAGVGLLTDRKIRHQGYATAMLNEVEAFSKEHLQLHQLWCDIAENNIVSIRLFEKCGFTLCGTKKDWIWNGNGWFSALTMQKIL